MIKIIYMEKEKKHKNLIFFQAKKIKINLWKNYYTLLYSTYLAINQEWTPWIPELLIPVLEKI